MLINISSHIPSRLAFNVERTEKFLLTETLPLLTAPFHSQSFHVNEPTLSSQAHAQARSQVSYEPRYRCDQTARTAIEAM